MVKVHNEMYGDIQDCKVWFGEEPNTVQYFGTADKLTHKSCYLMKQSLQHSF